MRVKHGCLEIQNGRMAALKGISYIKRKSLHFVCRELATIFLLINIRLMRDK